MNKFLKISAIVGVVIFAFSFVIGLIGVCLNNEFLFNFGLSFIFIILPVYLVVYFLIDFIAGIIKDRNKKE
jgi:hypothetical protein